MRANINTIGMHKKYTIWTPPPPPNPSLLSTQVEMINAHAWRSARLISSLLTAAVSLTCSKTMPLRWCGYTVEECGFVDVNAVVKTYSCVQGLVIGIFWTLANVVTCARGCQCDILKGGGARVLMNGHTTQVCSVSSGVVNQPKVMWFLHQIIPV